MDTVTRIFDLIKENNTTAKEVAKATGLSPSNFTEWKKGNNKPGYGAVVKIADHFGVEQDYLLCKTNNRYPQESIAMDSDIPYDELPPEAVKQIKDYITFIKEQHKKK